MNKILKNIKLIKKVKLLLFPFYNEPEIKKIFQIFEKDQTKNKRVAMFVGGCVRRYILGEEIDDIDIATIFTPNEIKKKFSDTDIKVVETGIEHGTVTLILKNKKFEITTLRKDIITDGRHAEVSFTDDWQLDSERRDFTFNAIYLDRKGKIYDPQLGLSDLKRGIVKFIGDPNKRIEEDYLRIIRFIRFTLYYDHKNFEKSTLEAIKLNLNGVNNISKERIFSELSKMLKMKNFINLSKKKDLQNIFFLIFPEFKYFSRLEKLEEISKLIEINEEIILGTMLIDKTDNNEYFCHKYKVSNNLKENLDFLKNSVEKANADKNFFKKNLKKNIYFFGKKKLKKINTIFFLINKNITYKEYTKFIESINKTTIPSFPYDGKYLISKGLNEGKKIGQVIKELEKSWIENNYELADSLANEIISKAKQN
ncbi:CCA tRNA nucleotidyltransferase [Pelagibacteraceae bacterium]|nr:CCA tRNA nucleotidyltransferase [Pelagibacteraceae bacterium]